MKERGSKIPHMPGQPKIITWLIRVSGGNIDEKEASEILIAFILVSFVLSLVLFFSSKRKRREVQQEIPREQIEGLIYP